MPRIELQNNHIPKPMDTLDLHGYTKDEAISRTTDFLDRSNTSMNPKNAWVLIITGSGAHSQQGPVLRGTVEALLAKRKIDYYLMKGKGSFLVNAASGFVLYEPSQPTDSKVIVAPNSVSLQNKGRIPIRRSILHRELSESMEESRKAMKKEFHNRCNEEAAFQKAVSKSLEEKAMEKAEEEQLLGQAVDLSLLEKQKEIDEEEKLDAAIEISKRESIVNTMDEDEQMRELLALSKAEFDQQRDPDAYLQHVIKLSKKERNEFDEKSRIPEECDEELLKVLELSAVDF